MSEITTVSLEGLKPAKNIRFIKAQWWDITSRFVIVFVRTEKDNERALRMDMNKKAFLDYLGDNVLDEYVRSKSGDIWNAVAHAMRESENTAAL
jgi:predicted Ser/Thr protein kinase